MSLLSSSSSGASVMRRAAIDGAGEIERRRLHFGAEPRPRMAGVERQRRRVGRAVVDHDDVEIGIVGALEQAGERLGDQRGSVAVRDDDADARPDGRRGRAPRDRAGARDSGAEKSGIGQVKDRAGRRGGGEPPRQRIVGVRPSPANPPSAIRRSRR